MQCRLCQNNTDLNLFPLKDGKGYFFCSQCEFIFLDPAQRLPLPQEKDRYLEHNNDLEDVRYLNYLAKTWKKLTQVPENAVVVDFGCGPTKGLEKVLIDRSLQVHSYDPIFFPLNFESLKGNVDVIFCSEALEHAFSPREVFDRWQQLLKPKGQIVLRTAFHSGLESLEGWWYREDVTHIGFFNEKTFQWLAKKWNWKLKHLHSPYVVMTK